MVAVPISITMEEVLNNEGEIQIMDLMTSYMDAAEKSLMVTMDAGIYSDGTANGGKQMGGFALAIPIDNTSGTYDGIDRAANTIRRTSKIDANSKNTAIGSQVNASTIRPFLNQILPQRARGRNYADLLLMSAEHYAAYDAATVGIQRITNSDGLGKLGFQTLQYFCGG